MSRIITITSGKGGVGKTSISLNLSLSLASKGFSVCLFDADLGLANVNILTGIHPKQDLESVISGQRSLDEIMIKNFQGIDIIPGSSGIEKIANLTKTQTATLISNFLDLKDYDYFIFDTSAGISSQVLSFCLTSQEIVLVVTDEPTSLTDAYAMLKILSKHKYNYPIKVVVNRVIESKTAKKAYLQLKKTANKFLSINIEPLGIIAADPSVQKAVISQTPFFISSPQTVASKCIKNITDKLIREYGKVDDLPLELFWGRCLAFFDKHAKTKTEETPIQENTVIREKTNIDTEKYLGFDTRLLSVESKLSDLIKEIQELKNIVKDQSVEPKNKANEIKIESWADTKRITLEDEPDIMPQNNSEPIVLHKTKKDQKPIVRGQLRNPTREELASWNGTNSPVVIADDMQKRRYR